MAAAFAVWQERRERLGASVTLIELYGLVAESRGLEAHELPLATRRELWALAMPVVMPGWALTGTAAPAPEPVDISDYDPGWPARYARWELRLRDSLGPVARRIEHVGSTSVPGLPAKPIVDIQLSVDDLADEDRYVPALERTGLLLRQRDDVHRFFRPPPERPREVHVHVCEVGSDWEAEHLLFRDWLREHDDARDAYVTAKRTAAERWRDDRMAYTEAKTAVILDLLADARAHATAQRK